MERFKEIIATLKQLLERLQGILSLGMRPLFAHILIVAGFLLLAQVVQEQYLESGKKTAAEWAIKEPPLMPIPTTHYSETVEKSSLGIKERLFVQIRTIASRSVRHLAIMEYYYSRFYMSIGMVLIFGVLSSVALLFLAKDGWMNTNQYIKTFFISSTAIAAYFGSFPSVFKHTQNIADNKTLYLQYVGLNNEAVSYIVTGENADTLAVSPKNFIHHLDKRMMHLNTFAIGFDDSKIPDFKTSFATE